MEDEPAVAVPVAEPSASCSNDLGLKTPTALALLIVPLDDWLLSHNNIGLYAVVSPETSLISGEPYTLVSLR